MIIENYRPMLAVDCPLEHLAKLKYPVLCQPKFDGIRALITPEGVMSRSGKLIPNKYIQETLAHLPIGLDGELILANNMTASFNKVSSAVMRQTGKPNFRYVVFDCFLPDLTQINRLNIIKEKLKSLAPNFRTRYVNTLKANNSEQVLTYYHNLIKTGFEGLILRNPTNFYKHGRSTLREQSLLKLKPFKDAEGIIVGLVEQQGNSNEATLTRHGLTERRYSKSKLYPKGTLGAFIVRAPGFEQFQIGTGQGLTDQVRKEIWDNQSDYIGKIIKFKYLEIGTVNKPRSPIMLGFRDKLDLDPSF